MTPERWQRARQILNEALEREPEEREKFLAEACSGDASLRDEVKALVMAHEQAGSFLGVPIVKAGLHADGRLAAGTKLGLYEIGALIGAGGMGEVYQATDSRLGRSVAIKLLPAPFAQDAERTARFEREARVLASLNHPNIAAIYGLEQSGEKKFLVMELVPGEALSEKIKRGAIPIEETLRIARQIAEALEAAHEKGVVHRDLKPANIHVTPDGKVKVLDFGVAKAVYVREDEESPTPLEILTVVESVTGQVSGTPPYMSPEQARGERVDQRTDIWSFGCLFYELLTGERTFLAGSLPETITAVLERDPDWQKLPARTPAKVRQLLHRCLQKDVKQRLPAIADARKTIEEAQGGWSRWRLAGLGALVLALAALGAIWFRPVRPTDSSQWVQLTKFPDSITQPALSPDGRMVAFIRGESTFYGPGQIYVKILPDGEPMQLTHDNLDKMSPVFSPDGTRVVYTTVNPDFLWDTWTVPVLGGEPQMMLKNASGLVWTDPRHIMFSEIRMGVHMAVVTSEESRMGQRDVYVPPDEPDMAHRSYPSPDGRWVLLVEMDNDYFWEPCRLVPADGSSSGRKVGPLAGGCTFAAWSPDGKWMYFTSNAVSANHIWRQRFPDGKPEQITAGPTAEEGIAMAPDGRSFVTAVSLQSASLWIHDKSGDRQISLEGNAAAQVFTPDGAKLLYRVARELPNEFDNFRDPGEVMVADLKSGRAEPLARGFKVLNFDISRDGRQVVIEASDDAERARLWLAPLDHSASPRQVPNVEGGHPHFGSDGEILFRHTEGGPAGADSGFIYRVLPDGSGLQKVIQQPVNHFNYPSPISPDGRWVFAFGAPLDNGPSGGQVYSLDGKPPIFIGGNIGGNGRAAWGAGGVLLSIEGESRSFFFPLAAPHILPDIPAGGLATGEEIARLPGARRIEGRLVTLGPSPDVYAYYKGNTQRNLYRIPVP